MLNEYSSYLFLLGRFIESCATESWESQEDDDWNTHILIDGVEQEGKA